MLPKTFLGLLGLFVLPDAFETYVHMLTEASRRPRYDTKDSMGLLGLDTLT